MQWPFPPSSLLPWLWVAPSLLTRPDSVLLPAEIECLVEIPTPQDYWGPVFAVCIFLFSFIIPVLIISICYSLMIRRLRGVLLGECSREQRCGHRPKFEGPFWLRVSLLLLLRGSKEQPKMAQSDHTT